MSDDKKIISLYLDDLRIPPNNKEWIIVRSYNEAIKWMKNNGCPDFISFDHDLGMIMRGKSIITDDFNAKNGCDLAKWMISEDIKLNGKFFPINFKYNIHSSNPTGSKNIELTLKEYFKEKVLQIESAL